MLMIVIKMDCDYTHYFKNMLMVRNLNYNCPVEIVTNDFLREIAKEGDEKLLKVLK